MLPDPGSVATSASIASHCDHPRVLETSCEDQNAKRRPKRRAKRARESEAQEDLHRCFSRLSSIAGKTQHPETHLAVRLDEVDAASGVDLQARELAGLRPVGRLSA